MGIFGSLADVDPWNQLGSYFHAFPFACKREFPADIGIEGVDCLN